MGERGDSDIDGAEKLDLMITYKCVFFASFPLFLLSCFPYLSPSVWGESRAGQRFGAGVRESVASQGRRRCSKAILICAHSHQCHSARLVSLQEHQSALSGTAVTNSNRYHFKTIGPAHCVWLKLVAGAHLGHGWMGPLRVRHTGGPGAGLNCWVTV